METQTYIVFKPNLFSASKQNISSFIFFWLHLFILYTNG